MSTDSQNREWQLAWDFVQHTDKHVFLTGRAGTGKTTFLRKLSKKSVKRMIVTAPTGVAAINAGGVTLHSFFQLPFGPFVPGEHAHNKIQKRMFRFSQEKKQIIKSLDLLVIDEISMVRADLLDAVDAILKRHRRNDLPFGGVQLLMIGDLHQLSPVAKREEWSLLSQYYDSIYFFSSHALAEARFLTIELKRVYRQTDSGFIHILNQVRNNEIDASLIEKLNQRYIKNFTPDDDQGYVTLTTHNVSADAINKQRIDALKGRKYNLEAHISGDFPEHNFPTFAALELKAGAQVMFLRNDNSAQKRYYNGKIGRVRHISDDEIRIICPDDSQEIVLEPVEWENIKYTVNQATKEIQEDIIGTFKQFPLKPAWAITIHKSQGLTFDKAIIDAENSFSHGQVYVALSRCKTFEGMVLTSPVPSRGIAADQTVLDFIEKEKNNTPDESFLQEAKISYQQKLVLECFDFEAIQGRLNYLVRLLLGNKNVIQVSGLPDIRVVQESAEENVFTVNEKFKHQLQGILRDNILPEKDARIKERTSKASAWFKDKFYQVFDDLLEKLSVETDNKEIGKQINNGIENLRQEIRVKLAGVMSCQNGFGMHGYLDSVSRTQLDFPIKKQGKPKAPVYTESDIDQPQLFEALRQWRLDKARENNVAVFVIMHQKVLVQIAATLPENEKELGKIKGVGKKTLEKYGQDILDIVEDYRKQNNK